MKLTKCEQCGGPTAEGLPLCPDCMRATGAAADQIGRGGGTAGHCAGPVHHGEHGREHS